MKKKKIIIIVLSIIVISNFPLLNQDILIAIDKEHFRYSNSNGSFTKIEKLDYKSGVLTKEKIERVIKNHVDSTNGNTKLFRIYRINPLCFWRWSRYLFVSKNFRYKNWKDIKKNRVKFNPDSKYQDF